MDLHKTDTKASLVAQNILHISYNSLDTLLAVQCSVMFPSAAPNREAQSTHRHLPCCSKSCATFAMRSILKSPCLQVASHSTYPLGLPGVAFTDTENPAGTLLRVSPVKYLLCQRVPVFHNYELLVNEHRTGLQWDLHRFPSSFCQGQDSENGLGCEQLSLEIFGALLLEDTPKWRTSS